MSTAAAPAGPVTLLIAALGGEGGGVLADWIVTAARAAGLPVQATSIPGVAQRTGATTYYVEIWPQPWTALNGREPVLALSPAAGEVDVLAASELLEAGRMIQAGFVTPDRTALVGSAHRVYATIEKMAMADGRFDRDRLLEAVAARSRSRVLFDMQAAAGAADAPLSAVLLGAIAAAGVLPVDADGLRDAIHTIGKATADNLRGFDAGLERGRRAGTGEMGARAAASEPGPAGEETFSAFPEIVRPTLAHAQRRLTDYQDVAYAALYLDRLRPFANADSRLLMRVARHLAVRMSYEDVIRVAQAKARPARFVRIRKEIGAGADEPVTVTEFFKPGFDELCDILPARLAAWLIARAERRPELRRWQRSVHLRSTTLWGYVRLRLLAGLRRWRRGTWRYAREQQAIEDWLGLVRAAVAHDAALALAVADCARLIKGYGDTHRRGLASFTRIVETLVRPALRDGHNGAAAAIAAACAAALADPEGKALESALASKPALRPAPAQPDALPAAS